MQVQPKLIAIVGGSGAGKTWLANRLTQQMAVPSALMSLDNFYLDPSHWPAEIEADPNFDHPAAVDWRRIIQALRSLRDGQPADLPNYDFVSHRRGSRSEPLAPAPLVLVEGLWLLLLPEVRALFDLKIYLECPTQLRLERRLARDAKERGRTAESVRTQFWKTVAPMHERFVEPQRQWADLVLQQPPEEEVLHRLVARLESFVPADWPRARISNSVPVATGATN